MEKLDMMKETLGTEDRIIRIPVAEQCAPEHPINGCGRFATLKQPELIDSVREKFARAGRTDWQNGLCVCVFEQSKEEERNRRRFEWANFPRYESPRRLEGFTLREGTQAAYSAVTEFVEGKGPRILTICGATGTGKSHLLEAAGRELYREGVGVRYIYVGALVDSFRDTYNDSTFTHSSLFRAYSTTPLLILDDLGAERQTDYGIEIVTRLVEDRDMHGGGRMLIASNLVFDDVEARYGPRLASRLWNQVEKNNFGNVTITATDYRIGAK